MFNLYNAQFQGLVLHRVGNKNRNEPLQLSANPLRLDDEISGLLKSYFFTPFTQREEKYCIRMAFLIEKRKARGF